MQKRNPDRKKSAGSFNSAFKQKRSFPKRSGGSVFTLIELLIVIAIIAILAGMLLPALNSAREMARSSSCVSKEKQLYLAIQGYAGDNQEFMPSAVMWKEELFPAYIKQAAGDSPKNYPFKTRKGGTGSLMCPSIAKSCYEAENVEGRWFGSSYGVTVFREGGESAAWNVEARISRKQYGAWLENGPDYSAAGRFIHRRVSTILPDTVIMNEKYMSYIGSGYESYSLADIITSLDRQNRATRWNNWPNQYDPANIKYAPNADVHKRKNNMMFNNGSVQAVKPGTKLDSFNWTFQRWP